MNDPSKQVRFSSLMLMFSKLRLARVLALDKQFVGVKTSKNENKT